MIKKILIANRGEIACRVAATAKRLGVRTVAVYSDADANAQHVSRADEAVHIGPPAVSESYLSAGKIIEAAKKTGADAIHPGYGFLSENPDFVEAVEAAGLIFIGPPASAIRAMGLKDAAKALMDEAGVPVVPGYHGENQDPDFLYEKSREVGYPVLIKARAGGGGKGMRLVEQPEDFKAALQSARREAESGFGDPACLIEKYINRPRHIEIQVFGDAHGNVVHLFERDCSLQRRHQKVIEEAPAPDMPENVRAAMGKAAVEAARAIGYQGAGTVEFIADGSGPLREDGFWFMEMNTRLQVEHPVSEAITGLDFVELQLRVAAGEPLPFTQNDLSISGWSFEARLYAEDVPKGFLPATGKLHHLRFPEGTEFENGPLRIDSGITQGDEISPWYDPMIAKIIVHGPDRATALNRLTRALEECEVAGCVTNLEFLSALSRHDGFQKGDVDTGLIARDIGLLTSSGEAPPRIIALAAISGLGLLEKKPGTDPFDILTGWRHWTEARQTIHLKLSEREVTARVVLCAKNRYQVAFDGSTIELEVAILSAGRFRVIENGIRSTVSIVSQPDRVTVFQDGRQFGFGLPDALSGMAEAATGGDLVIAPMPGLVKLVSTAPGAEVSAGDPLITLEAMKMEHTLPAPRDGIVEEVLVAAGDQVTDGMVLARLEVGQDL